MLSLIWIEKFTFFFWNKIFYLTFDFESNFFRMYFIFAKIFSLFFMTLLNAMLLHQPLQDAHFRILADFSLFLLVCLKLYNKTFVTMTFYIKQYENLSWFLFDSFLTCNCLKNTSSIPIEDFTLNFNIFITIYSVFCLKKFCPKESD